VNGNAAIRCSPSVRPAACKAVVALVVLVMLLGQPLFAALGGDRASVDDDRIHLQASLRILPGAGYTVHELHTANGIIVREYISASGTVFGVAWQGPWFPDMRQLLASYFEEYEQVMQSESGTRGMRRPIQVELPDLVVHAGGHPRAFFGQAYIPQKLPQAVRAEDVR
jgi:hypothetical protein